MRFFKEPEAVPRPRKILYYFWWFPELSEIFIRREIMELKSLGLDVEIWSQIPAHDQDLGPEARRLGSDAHYLYPHLTKENEGKCFSYFFRKRPLVVIRLLVFIFLRRYRSARHRAIGIEHFTKGLVLARNIENRGVAHIHSPWSDFTAITALVASRLLSITYSIDARSFELYRNTEGFMLPEKVKYAKFVRVNSRYNRDHLNALTKGRYAGKIHVIYGGLDLSRFVGVGDKGRISAGLRILSVGRIIEEKGFHVLAKALKILEGKGVDLKCEIVGGLPENDAYHETLERLILDLGLKDKMTLSGSQPLEFVMKKYREADIFVLPCVVAQNGGRDNIPNALKEAMAMKLAVISTDITGMPELVDNGKNGILVPENDVEALATAIGNLAKNKEIATKLGENARIKIEEKFDLSKNAGRLYELLVDGYSAREA
jgi:glycosyltransferase involved in cell wall biosynthesis